MSIKNQRSSSKILLVLLAVITATIFAYSTPTLAKRKKLVIVGDYWCPYNCIPDSTKQGFLVELVSKSLYIYGISIEYQMIPWHIALQKVEKGEVDGIIGLNDIKGTNLVIPNLPLAYSTIASYTKADTNWTYDGINSLRGKKLGLIMDYTLGEDISNFVGINYAINPGRFVVEDGENAVGSLMHDLIEQKIDVYIEDQRVGEHYIDEYHLSALIKNSGIVSSDKLPIFIAFNKDIPDIANHIKQLEEGIASLKATGEYQHLLDKYDMGAQ